MSKFWNKLLTGAGIGFLLGGPYGAVLGATLAGGTEASHHTTGGTRGRQVFTTNLAILLTLVARADRNLQPTEARTIADFFKNSLDFGEAELAKVRQIMKETVRNQPSAEKIARNFARVSSSEERLWILEFSWQLARADGPVSDAEERMITRIANSLGISAVDQESIAADYVGGRGDDYQVLGIEPHAGIEEIKAAYRRKAKDYHPDRVSHLGKDYEEVAHDKFARISAAYKAIRLERGF